VTTATPPAGAALQGKPEGGLDDAIGEPRQLDLVLTVEELAEFLRVNHKTVREAIARGEIPGVRRIGTTIRISREAVVNWMNSGQGRVSHSKRSR